jgi:hypothetical protein
MMRKMRTFLAALLMAPALMLNANAFTTETGDATLNPSQPVAGSCWIYFAGRWILVPC